MSANARRVRLQHPLEIDGKRVETLRVRWPSPHLVDDALSAFGDAVFLAASVIREATGKAIEPADVAREAGIPIPTPNPGPLHPLPTPRPTGPAEVNILGTPAVSITAPVTTLPSGVQDVKITNPTPVHAPINVTVYATSNDPAGVGREVGARVQDAVSSNFGDGGGGW